MKAAFYSCPHLCLIQELHITAKVVGQLDMLLAGIPEVELAVGKIRQSRVGT